MRTPDGMSLYGPRVVRLPEGVTRGFSTGWPLRSRMDSFNTAPRYGRFSRVAGSGSAALDTQVGLSCRYHKGFCKDCSSARRRICASECFDR